MARPTHWIVFYGTSREYFINRTRARLFAAIRRGMGDTVRIEAHGFD